MGRSREGEQFDLAADTEGKLTSQKSSRKQLRMLDKSKTVEPKKDGRNVSETSKEVTTSTGRYIEKYKLEQF